MEPRSNTREKLIDAARQLVHHQGLYRTSLNEIAHAAGVPLGNVYYHFRTKESLVAAVIDGYARDVCKNLLTWEMATENPIARLKLMVNSAKDMTEVFARYGCPHGSLCSELDGDDTDERLAKAATNLLKLHVDWAAGQFQLLGHSAPQAQAMDLVSALQGAYLLANTYRSTDLLKAQLARLERWVDDMAAQPPTGANRAPAGVRA